MDKKRVPIKIKLRRPLGPGPHSDQASLAFTLQLSGGNALPSQPSFSEAFQGPAPAPLPLSFSSQEPGIRSQNRDCQPSPAHFPDKETEAAKVLDVSLLFQSAEQLHRPEVWCHPRSPPSKQVPFSRPSFGDVYTRITITSLIFIIKDKCHRHKVPVIKSKHASSSPTPPGLLASPEGTRGRGSQGLPPASLYAGQGAKVRETPDLGGDSREVP